MPNAPRSRRRLPAPAADPLEMLTPYQRRRLLAVLASALASADWTTITVECREHGLYRLSVTQSALLRDDPQGE